MSQVIQYQSHIASNYYFLFLRYLENPVLFDRPKIGKVKFDIRYILLLQSSQPLKVYAYNRFWLRFANQPFSLEELDIYEKHFTVMNYSEESDLKQVRATQILKILYFPVTINVCDLLGHGRIVVFIFTRGVRTSVTKI